MGGFSSTWRRMASVSIVLLVVFGIPNVASAQAPKFPTARLPWQTLPPMTTTASFDNGWARVVSDTEQLLRRFSTPSSLRNAVIIDAVARAAAARAIWATNEPRYTPPPPKPPSVRVAKIRVSLAPVEIASQIAAESRNLSGVLAGLQFHWVD